MKISQFRSGESVADILFRMFPDGGFYVEAGAHNGLWIDGVGGSATHKLERSGLWKGLCIEPGHQCQFLRNNRNCKIDNACLGREEGVQVTFRDMTGDHSELSGITSHFNDHHDRQTRPHKDVTKTTIKLSTVLALHKAPSIIEHLTLDTEGSELDILKGHDFKAYRFMTMLIEHNNVMYRRELLRQFLTPLGYVLADDDGQNLFFIDAKLDERLSNSPTPVSSAVSGLTAVTRESMRKEIMAEFHANRPRPKTRFELVDLVAPVINPTGMAEAPKKIIGVEVGTDQGVYASQLLTSYPDLFLYCVDPFLPYAEITDDRSYAKDQFKKNMARFEGKDRFCHLNLSSVEGANQLAGAKEGRHPKIDFVYIDGAHDSSSVLTDLEAWWPLVKVGGFMAGHDFELATVYPVVIAFAVRHRLDLQLINEYGGPDVVVGRTSGMDRNGGWSHVSFYFYKEREGQ